MKKMIRTITAALLTISCLPVTYASAADGNYGTAALADFGNYEIVDTKGMLGTVYVRYGKTGYQDKNGNNVMRNNVDIYSLHPRNEHIQFRLREGLEVDTSRAKVLEIAERYYPGVKAAWDSEFNSAWVGQGIEKPDYQLSYAGFSQSKDYGLTYDLYDTQKSDDSDQKSKSLMYDLSAAGLLSEFYGWGQTADYEKIEIGSGVLCYPNCSEDDEKYDLEAVKNYLTAHHAECNLVMIGTQMEEAPNRYRYAFRIEVPEAETAEDEFALAVELYEKLGIKAQYSVLETMPGSMLFGSNSMERPGDANLDCVVDILDVIAANKNILGVGTLDKTGVKNVDMNGNGTADSEDSLAILKAALDIDD